VTYEDQFIYTLKQSMATPGFTKLRITRYIFYGHLYRIVFKSDEECRKYDNVSQISQLLKALCRDQYWSSLRSVKERGK